MKANSVLSIFSKKKNPHAQRMCKLIALSRSIIVLVSIKLHSSSLCPKYGTLLSIGISKKNSKWKDSNMELSQPRFARQLASLLPSLRV